MSIPNHAIVFYQDGKSLCCVFGDFVNLQESPAGFGATIADALRDLRDKTSDEERHDYIDDMLDVWTRSEAC